MPRPSRQSCFPTRVWISGPTSEHLRGAGLSWAGPEHSTAAQDPQPGSIRAAGSWNHLSSLWAVPGQLCALTWQKVTAVSQSLLPVTPPFLGCCISLEFSCPGTAGLQGSRWELRAQFPGKCSEICLCCSPKAFGRFQPEELLLQEAAWLVLSLGMGKEPLSSRKGLSSPLFPPDRLSSVMARGRAS